MFEIDLDGRVAIVTGGSRGIGRACVEALTAAGARCVVAYRDPARASDVAALIDGITRLGGEAVEFCGDLTQPAVCRDLMDAAVRNFGALHIVVNNAGLWRRAEIATMTEEQLLETLDLNLKAVFRLTQQSAKAMAKMPAGGVLIQIASTAGERGEAHYSHYAAAKGAVIAMVKSLARELGPRIRINAVSPGWIETEMTAAALAPAERRAIEAALPLRRIGLPQDVANAVVFLASDLAQWMTGAVLRVNGGGVLGED
ncbi:MAG: SDR family NAD(P)-dependent oxidoreductase [Planctomycetota bacterium]